MARPPKSFNNIARLTFLRVNGNAQPREGNVLRGNAMRGKAGFKLRRGDGTPSVPAMMAAGGYGGRRWRRGMAARSAGASRRNEGGRRRRAAAV
jgi:hypothetical protein